MGRSAAHVKAHSDISVHDTPRIVAFVTLGQSPRIDLIPEILDFRYTTFPGFPEFLDF